MYRLILEHIIRHILQEEEFTNLNVRSFVDHESRTNKFVDYLKSNTPISFKGGEPKTITSVEILKKGEKNPTSYNPKTQSDELKAVLPDLKAGDKLHLIDTEGKAHSITTVSKTVDLGGLGKGGSTKPEQREIANLQKQFEEINAPITLIIGGQKFKGVDGVVDIRPNQKADFAFTINKVPAIFISYKPGSSPKDMISYGGITKEVNIEEVRRFIEAVKSKTSSMKNERVEYGYPVEDLEVIKKVVYGFEYKEGAAGENNVQFLVQGTGLKLVSNNDNNYTLEASHILKAPTVPTGAYTPYYNARYANDRNQFGIQNCRFTVVPFGARKNIKNPFE